MAANSARKNNSTLMLALAIGQSVPEAARAAGVGERTVRRKLDDEEFRRELSNVRTRIIGEAVGRLTAASTLAVRTLETLLKSAESETVRLGAARTILERSVSMRESLELAERLERVEQQLEVQIDGPGSQT